METTRFRPFVTTFPAMRYLADPGLVQWSAGPWVFSLLLGLGLPIVALRQHRAMRLDARATRLEIYTGALVTHAVLLLLVWLVMRGQEFALLPGYRYSPWHLLVGLVALALGLVPLLERLNLNDRDIEARTRLIAPRSGREHALFYGVSLSAGFAEELAYRGLLFTLAASLTASWWLAAVVCSALFGIVHLFQGWKGAGIASLMGLREHLVVGLTGTLVVAIVVHILHDAIAGTVIGLRARREEGRSVVVS